MKKIITSLLFICFYLFSFAQNEEKVTPHPFGSYNKYWKIDYSIGTNFDLQNSSSNPNSKLLYSRTDIAPAACFKISHLFSKRWGWNASVQIDYYREKKSEYSPQSPIGDLIEELYFNELFWPVSIMHPSIEAGIIYRIERKRWNVHPTVGIGYLCYLMDRESTSTTNNNGVKTVTTYKQNASIPFINIGVSTDYFFSKKCFVNLNTNFRQPVKSSSAELYQTQNGVETSRISYKANSAGRSLNINLGFGFIFGRK